MAEQILELLLKQVLEGKSASQIVVVVGSSRYLRFHLASVGIGHKVLRYYCSSAHYSWTDSVSRRFSILDVLTHSHLILNALQ